MTTATLRVVTVDHTFTDIVSFRHDDDSNVSEVKISDTVVTELQAAFDELVANASIVDLRLYNSGSAPAANYVQTGTITSAKLETTQEKNGLVQVDTFVLTFTLG